MTELYAFKYLRADREEVEQGPFLAKRKAEEGKKKMLKMGAVCTDVYPIKSDPEQVKILKARKGDYLAEIIAVFEIYLSRELSVLAVGVGYNIVYDYINELAKRIDRFIKHNMPTVFSEFNKEAKEKLARYRKEYLKGVADILKQKSRHYSPMNGSVPESIGKLLQDLSDKYLRMQ